MLWKRVLLGVVGLVFLVVVFAFGVLIGAIVGEMGDRNRRFMFEERAIAPVLDADPAYARVEISQLSYDGSAYLSGEVPTRQDFERLGGVMADLFGSVRQIDPLAGVSVRDEKSATEAGRIDP